MLDDPSVLHDTSTVLREPPAARSGGVGPLWYLREGVSIARFDSSAMRRAADDPRALFYGMVFIAVGTLAQVASLKPANTTFGRALVAGLLTIPIQLVIGALSTAIMHGAARWFFGATGRYMALLRVLWLVSIVGWLRVIPVVGPLIAGIWSLLLSLVVFEEIDGIERLQALMLGVVFTTLTLLATGFAMTAFR